MMLYMYIATPQAPLVSACGIDACRGEPGKENYHLLPHFSGAGFRLSLYKNRIHVTYIVHVHTVEVMQLQQYSM